MKKIVLIFSMVLAAGFLTSWKFTAKKEKTDFSQYTTKGLDLQYNVSTTLEEELTTPHFFTPKTGKSYMGFREALAFKESQGDYFVVNAYGYLGKYQFGIHTLSFLGVHNPESFLASPLLQESVFKAYTARNKWVLKWDIKRYTGKKMNGVLITESGILAAAHLAGPGNVKKYLRSGGVYQFSDAFGTSIRYYLKKFSGYDTTLIKAQKNPKIIRCS